MAIDFEVMAGSNKQNKGNGKEPTMFWEHDFGEVTDSDLEKILKIPGIDDMAGNLARTNFKTDDERISYLRVIRRLVKFNAHGKMDTRLTFIRECLASKLGMMAFGKTLQLQGKTGLIAPAVIREQLSMRRLKEKEDTVRSSDFRQESESKEPKQEH